MIHIAGLWEFGYSTPLAELDLWQYPLREFKVDKFYMSPVTGIRSDYVTEIENLETLIEQMRMVGMPIVFVDERGSTELQKFEHPEKALYVFGKATISPMQAYQRPDDLSIVLKTPSDTGMLWPHQCAVTILYDRMMKCQSK